MIADPCRATLSRIAKESDCGHIDPPGPSTFAKPYKAWTRRKNRPHCDPRLETSLLSQPRLLLRSSMLVLTVVISYLRSEITGHHLPAYSATEILDSKESCAHSGIDHYDRPTAYGTEATPICFNNMRLEGSGGVYLGRVAKPTGLFPQRVRASYPAHLG